MLVSVRRYARQRWLPTSSMCSLPSRSLPCSSASFRFPHRKTFLYSDSPSRRRMNMFVVPASVMSSAFVLLCVSDVYRLRSENPSGHLAPTVPA